METLWAGLLGIAGVIAGVAFNEFVRRNSRIEAYSARVFDRRLSLYEELMRLMHEAYKVAHDVMENPSYSVEQRLGLISEAIHSVATFTDANEMYLDEELSAHCIAAIMGAEDVFNTKDSAEQEELKRHIREGYVEARRMIREDSGIAAIDKLFKNVTKPRLASPIIDQIRYYRRHPEALRSNWKEKPNS